MNKHRPIFHEDLMQDFTRIFALPLRVSLKKQVRIPFVKFTQSIEERFFFFCKKQKVLALPREFFPLSI